MSVTFFTPEEYRECGDRHFRLGRETAFEDIITRFEASLCFDKYDCTDERCLGIMRWIEIVKEQR